MAVFLLGIITRQIFHQQRPGPDYGHVALEDVEQFRQLVEAGGAEELAVGVQPHVVGEQVPLCVTLVGHGAELDEPEYPFALARAGLREEGVAMHLDGAEDGEHEQQRAQGENRGQRAAEVQGSFEEAGVHIPPNIGFRWISDNLRGTGRARNEKKFEKGIDGPPPRSYI